MERVYSDRLQLVFSAVLSHGKASCLQPRVSDMKSKFLMERGRRNWGPERRHGYHSCCIWFSSYSVRQPLRETLRQSTLCVLRCDLCNGGGGQRGPPPPRYYLEIRLWLGSIRPLFPSAQLCSCDVAAQRWIIKEHKCFSLNISAGIHQHTQLTLAG